MNEPILKSDGLAIEENLRAELAAERAARAEADKGNVAAHKALRRRAEAAEQERDRLRAQLQVAKSELEQELERTKPLFDAANGNLTLMEYWRGYRDCLRVRLKAIAKLNAGAGSAGAEFRDRPLAVPVALDARGNDTREIPVQSAMSAEEETKP